MALNAASGRSESLADDRVRPVAAIAVCNTLPAYHGQPKHLIVSIGALVPVALCCCACTARASSSTDELAPQRARSTALYEETLGAEAPAWEMTPEAFRLWTELAKAGDAEAKYYLSGVYFRGIPDLLAADSNVALALLEEAADGGVHCTVLACVAA